MPNRFDNPRTTQVRTVDTPIVAAKTRRYDFIVMEQHTKPECLAGWPENSDTLKTKEQ